MALVLHTFNYREDSFKELPERFFSIGGFQLRVHQRWRDDGKGGTNMYVDHRPPRSRR